MKKLVIMMLLLLGVMEVAAQSHSFRDTVQVRYEQFDMEAWLLSDTHHTFSLSQYPLIRGYGMFVWDDVLQYNYTDSPTGVDVVGLSAVIFGVGPLQYPMQPPEYLLLYDAMNDAFELKGQLQWEETDTAGRPFYDEICGPVDSVVHHASDYNVVHMGNDPRIFDLYFEKPITVYDSFYVGATSRFWAITGETHPVSSYGYYVYELLTWNDDFTETSGAYKPLLWKIFHYGYDANLPVNQWSWVPSNCFMMVLPIINVVDTSFANAPECPRVSGMFLRGNYTDTVTLQWAYDTLHDEFEVSYGRVGTVPDDGTVVTVRDNKWQFADSAYNDTQMVVYVRTVCREYDTLRWSGWSVPMYMCVHYDIDTAQQEGIEVPEEVSDLQRFVRMMPNPASGSVIVMSSYGMERVEVYDARGGRVYDSPAKGTSTGFDVSSWAKGTYVVLVRTPAGTAAKRLVVN